MSVKHPLAAGCPFGVLPPSGSSGVESPLADAMASQCASLASAASAQAAWAAWGGRPLRSASPSIGWPQKTQTSAICGHHARPDQRRGQLDCADLVFGRDGSSELDEATQSIGEL